MQHISRTVPSIDEIDCFTCESGCVHFEFGSTMMSFDRGTFLHIAELFDETRAELMAEDGLTGEWADELVFDEKEK